MDIFTNSPFLVISPLVPYLLLILGFVALVKGADLLVDGGAALAKRLKIKPLVIGLTIVAFGTSAPEFVVTFFASASGSADLAISNIVGSVTANTLLGLGLAAVIYPLTVQKGTVWREIPFSLLAIVVLIILVNDSLVPNGGVDQLSWVDGLVLLSFFAIFLVYTFGLTRATAADDVPEKIESLPTTRALVYVVLGLLMLFLGGNWIVNNGTVIAASLGVSESLIGLLVTGPGTSLPELATIILAARRKNVDLAVGGVIGSNIFNIFLILGTSALVGPLLFDSALNLDLGIILVATILLFSALFIGKRQQVERWQGIGFLVVYVVYLVFLFFRG